MSDCACHTCTELATLRKQVERVESLLTLGNGDPVNVGGFPHFGLHTIRRALYTDEPMDNRR